MSWSELFLLVSLHISRMVIWHSLYPSVDANFFTSTSFKLNSFTAHRSHSLTWDLDQEVGSEGIVFLLCFSGFRVTFGGGGLLLTAPGSGRVFIHLFSVFDCIGPALRRGESSELFVSMLSSDDDDDAIIVDDVIIPVESLHDAVEGMAASIGSWRREVADIEFAVDGVSS